MSRDFFEHREAILRVLNVGQELMDVQRGSLRDETKRPALRLLHAIEQVATAEARAESAISWLKGKIDDVERQLATDTPTYDSVHGNAVDLDVALAQRATAYELAKDAAAAWKEALAG